MILYENKKLAPLLERVLLPNSIIYHVYYSNNAT